ncbi:hypothetical protein [Paraburkholderia caffeinilytica]
METETDGSSALPNHREITSNVLGKNEAARLKRAAFTHYAILP